MNSLVALLAGECRDADDPGICPQGRAGKDRSSGHVEVGLDPFDVAGSEADPAADDEKRRVQNKL